MSRPASHRTPRRRSWVVWPMCAVGVALVAVVALLVTGTAGPVLTRLQSLVAVPSAVAAPSVPAATAPGRAAPVPPSPTTTAPAAPQRGLAQAAVDAAQAKASPSTQLGVAVLDRTTGELAVGTRGHEPFYTASLSKLIVIVDVLDRRRAGQVKVTDDDLALFRRALALSDDSAMNALWERFDGAGAVGRVSARLKLEHTTAPPVVGQWGQVEVTPADYVKVWHYVLDEMPAADRDLMLTDMQAAPSIAKDGFDQGFGLLSPGLRAESDAVAKQGWMCCFSGKYYLHTSGTVGADKRFVMAVLTRQPKTIGWDAARAQVTGITTGAVGALRE